MIELVYNIFYANSLENTIVLMGFLVFLWCVLNKCMCKMFLVEDIWKIFNGVFSGTIILGIVTLTVLSRTIELSDVQYIPFISFLEAQYQPEIYRSMFMNVFLFFPMGLTLPYALPEKWNRKAFITILCSMTLSIIIEYLQYHYHLGRAETDDVLCNTLGAIIGTLSYTLSRKFNRK